MRHEYRGHGWLVPIFAILYLVGRGLIEAAFHPHIWASPLLSFVVGAGYGWLIWRLGRRLNRRPLPVEEWSKSEGFTVKHKAAHSYWFVPFEYWGIAMAVASIALDAWLRSRPIIPLG